MAVETWVQPPRTMQELYFSLPEGTHVQLIENVLVMTPAFFEAHARLRSEIGVELSIFVKEQKAGSVIFPMHDIYLDSQNIFQPDISFFSTKHLHHLHESGTHGVPDLIVEILSSETARYDLNEKKNAYERFDVTEYWIINPEDDTATGYFLEGDQYHEFFKEEGVLESKLLGCRIKF